jgi:hypothetical protein
LSDSRRDGNVIENVRNYLQAIDRDPGRMSLGHRPNNGSMSIGQMSSNHNNYDKYVFEGSASLGYIPVIIDKHESVVPTVLAYHVYNNDVSLKSIPLIADMVSLPGTVD